jgi:ElaB/YqjD/DUF883 family membrane-anchored ribosome-binding protein
MQEEAAAMAKEAMTEENEERAAPERRGDARAVPASDGEEAFEQAKEAGHALRSAIDRASRALRELGRTGEEWAKDAEGRAIELGKGLQGQGERAVGGLARQVQQNPLTSLGIAFALGVICAVAARR